MKKVLIADGLQKNAVEQLKCLGIEVIERHFEQEELGEALKEFDAVVIRSASKINKAVLDKELGGKLKLIIRGGVGVDNIDVDYAVKNGIIVKNTPNASSVSVAELAIAHIFALARFINISNVTMRDGKWNKKKYVGTEITGKTLGVIGLGRIGRETAKRATALGMKVIYFDFIGEVPGVSEYEYYNLDELLAKSDFISLHVPYDAKQGSLIGKEEFAKMKEGAYIINCARGKVVDEVALLEALNSGKVAGAGIDVFEQEPTQNLELVSHPKVSVTPHIGASTNEAQEKIGEEVVNIIKEFFNL